MSTKSSTMIRQRQRQRQQWQQWQQLPGQNRGMFFLLLLQFTNMCMEQELRKHQGLVRCSSNNGNSGESNRQAAPQWQERRGTKEETGGRTGWRFRLNPTWVHSFFLFFNSANNYQIDCIRNPFHYPSFILGSRIYWSVQIYLISRFQLSPSSYLATTGSASI